MVYYRITRKFGQSFWPPVTTVQNLDHDETTCRRVSLRLGGERGPRPRPSDTSPGPGYEPDGSLSVIAHTFRGLPRASIGPGAGESYMASIAKCFHLLLLPTVVLSFSVQSATLQKPVKFSGLNSKSFTSPRLARLPLCGLKAVFLGENEQKEVGSIKMPVSLQEERLEADRVLSRATEEGKLTLKEAEQLQQLEAAQLQQALEQVILWLLNNN